MEIVLIDSPFANLGNIARALRKVGAKLNVTADPAEVRAAPAIVLPGVGSFVAAMNWLRERQLDNALSDAVAAGAALLGICVGHQLLFERSDEMGGALGLGLLRGSVERFGDCGLPVPQVGWNRVSMSGSTELFDGIPPATEMYFVNSYRVAECESAVATASYGGSFVAAAQQERVFGVQFHPEKSSSWGLRMLGNFVARSGSRR